jgi:hypothetical protein
VPHSVRSFRELHEHTDPNCYGGFCEENGLLDALFAEYGVDADNWLAQAGVDYIDACQNAINDWLANAGHLLDDMQDQTAAIELALTHECIDKNADHLQIKVGGFELSLDMNADVLSDLLALIEKHR